MHLVHPACTPAHKQQWSLSMVHIHFFFFWHRKCDSRVRRCYMSVRSRLLVLLAYLGTLMGPCPCSTILVTSHPCAARLSSMVWLSTTTYTPSLPGGGLGPTIAQTCASTSGDCPPLTIFTICMQKNTRSQSKIASKNVCPNGACCGQCPWLNYTPRAAKGRPRGESLHCARTARYF